MDKANETLKTLMAWARTTKHDRKLERPWIPEEDRELRGLVEQYGASNWVELAARFAEPQTAEQTPRVGRSEAELRCRWESEGMRALRAEMTAMKIPALRKKALAVGVVPWIVELAGESEDPKEAIISSVLEVYCRVA